MIFKAFGKLFGTFFTKTNFARSKVSHFYSFLMSQIIFWRNSVKNQLLIKLKVCILARRQRTAPISEFGYHSNSKIFSEFCLKICCYMPLHDQVWRVFSYLLVHLISLFLLSKDKVQVMSHLSSQFERIKTESFSKQ